MADRTQQILPGGQSSAPYTYTIPGSTAFSLLAVRATFDGTGAGGAFLPTVQLFSDSGVLMAQRTAPSVAATASADVTFAPFLGGATTAAAGVTLNDVIIAASPDAWWKLDETSGTVAHDSSGNGHDLSVPVGSGTPTWNQAPAPTGVNAPLFTKTAPRTGLNLPGYTALTGAFTVLGWFYRTDTSFAIWTSEDDPIASGGTGWALNVDDDPVAGTGKGLVYANDGVGGPSVIASDNLLPHGAWHFQGLVYSGGTFTQYVDGAAQAQTMAPAWTPASTIQIGDTNGSRGFNGYASYVTVFGRALSASAIGAIYTAAPG